MVIIAGATAAWAVVVGCAVVGVHGKHAPAVPALSLMPPIQPLIENVGTVDLFPMPLCGDFKLEEATIDDIQKALHRGALTSQELVLCYLQRTYQTQEYIKYVFPTWILSVFQARNPGGAGTLAPLPWFSLPRAAPVGTAPRPVVIQPLTSNPVPSCK
jgi:hypothetical protein